MDRSHLLPRQLTVNPSYALSSITTKSLPQKREPKWVALDNQDFRSVALSPTQMHAHHSFMAIAIWDWLFQSICRDHTIDVRKQNIVKGDTKPAAEMRTSHLEICYNHTFSHLCSIYLSEGNKSIGLEKRIRENKLKSCENVENKMLADQQAKAKLLTI